MMEKMRVAKMIAPEKIQIFEEEIPKPKEDEVLVKVHACGVCHSDVPYFKGLRAPGPPGMKLEFPYPIGHELNGVIIEVGSRVKDFKVGDRVGGLIFASYATHVVCRTERLGKIADGMSLETTLAEPLMCITNIVRAATPEIGDTVACVGSGFMGLLAMAAMSHSYCKEIIALDFIDERLEWAKKMGATRTINPKNVDALEEVKKYTDGKGVDIAIDITGRYSGLALAAKIVKGPRGKILAPSFYTTPDTVDMGSDLLSKVPIIHSVHPGYSKNYRKDVEDGVWADKMGIMPIEKLITHRFSLDQMDEVFKMLLANPPGFIKGVVVM